MKIIIILIFMTISFLASSQSKPRVPNAPKTTTTSSSSSVSIQNSDSSYSLKAHFDSDKNEKVKKILLDNLDKKYLIAKGQDLIWRKSDDNEIAYTVTFKNSSLKINVDKELTSESAIKKFETLGDELRETISNN